MAQLFELMVFTASHKDYADEVVKHLDPKKQLFSHCFYRRHCSVVANTYVKSLKRIGNRSAQDILILDNFIQSFALDLKNGIPIRPFENQEVDCELENIADVLSRLKSYEDVREFVKKEFRLDSFYEFLRC